MTPCADYARHEAWCRCSTSPKINWRTTDGCSGRLCPECAQRVDLRNWPDIEERIAGPEAGLDALELLRALR